MSNIWDKPYTTYYLCTIARRKNGRRHIVGKYDTEREAIDAAKNINTKRYRIQICSGDWVYTYHYA